MMQNRAFYDDNKKFIEKKPHPETEELISIASKQLKIEKNEDEKQRTSLFFLIDSFRDFVEETPQGRQPFWILDEPQNGLFPLEELKATLNNFLLEKNVWNCQIVDCYYKHEHFVVLVFLAALRYVKCPPPQRQKKFDNESQSWNKLMDLFLWNVKCFKNWAQAAAYALQVNILVSNDVDSNQVLKHNSLRSNDYRSKELWTNDQLKKYNLRLARSKVYGLKTFNDPAQTQGFVVHVRPFEVTWDDVGKYPEGATPENLVLDLQDFHHEENPAVDNSVQNNAAEDQDKPQDEEFTENSQSMPSTQCQTQVSACNSQSQQKGKKSVHKETFQLIPSQEGAPNLSPNQIGSVMKSVARKTSASQTAIRNASDDQSLCSQNKENISPEVKANKEGEQLINGIRRGNNFKQHSDLSEQKNDAKSSLMIEGVLTQNSL